MNIGLVSQALPYEVSATGGEWPNSRGPLDERGPGREHELYVDGGTH
jgi:hypothetical protein